MKRFIIHLVINALALFAAIRLVPGIRADDTGFWAIVALALIFGIVNALIRPVLKFLTCPLIILTLGLFLFVLNTFLFYLTGRIGSIFEVGFTVTSIWSAFLGALVVSVVNLILGLFFKEDLHNKKDA
ncbi:phage holin family protein [Acidobacteriota bacterium]